jgi:hypothetical protein
LEEAVKTLHEQLAAGQVKPPVPPQPWWERNVGLFKDSPIFDEIVKEMEKNRQADYAAAAKAGKPRKERQGKAAPPSKVKKTG